MFQSLSDKLANAFKKFRNKGKLTESDVKEGMREIKLALLEADVSFKVVKDFIKKVSERAVGAEVLESLLPAQQVVKIVNEELIELMGKTQAKLEISSKPPSTLASSIPQIASMSCGFIPPLLIGSAMARRSAAPAHSIIPNNKTMFKVFFMVQVPFIIFPI